MKKGTEKVTAKRASKAFLGRPDLVLVSILVILEKDEGAIIGRLGVRFVHVVRCFVSEKKKKKKNR